MEARYFDKLGTVQLPGGDFFPADTMEAASRGLVNRGYRRTVGWLPGTGGIWTAIVERGPAAQVNDDDPDTGLDDADDSPVISYADLDRICAALRERAHAGNSGDMELLERLRRLRAGTNVTVTDEG